jgi:hypothetical protein
MHDYMQACSPVPNLHSQLLAAMCVDPDIRMWYIGTVRNVMISKYVDRGSMQMVQHHVIYSSERKKNGGHDQNTYITLI